MPVVLRGSGLVGSLLACELTKGERDRSEFSACVLAVARAWRRRGIATTSVAELRAIAARAGDSPVSA